MAGQAQFQFFFPEALVIMVWGASISWPQAWGLMWTQGSCDIYPVGTATSSVVLAWEWPSLINTNAIFSQFLSSTSTNPCVRETGKDQNDQGVFQFVLFAQPEPPLPFPPMESVNK